MNVAINGWKAISGTVVGMARDLKASAKMQTPLFHAFANDAAKKRFAESKLDLWANGGDWRNYAGFYGWRDMNKAKVFGALGAGYAVADSIGRLATGGTLTRNADGNRDIVGIPLI
jgi:hypothetical protein